MSEIALCELCGEPMPPGEEMFKFHGYSSPCPKPPLPRPKPVAHQAATFLSDLAITLDTIGKTGDAKDCREWAKRLWAKE